MPVWVRGEETAEIVGPFPQPLVVTALGNSGATPADGITAEVIGFDNLEALEAAPESAVRGKIVFVGHNMTPTQDGSGYGYYGGARRQGPSVASAKGAAGIVIRSIGTDYHRNPHTGVMTFTDGATPIPAGALSVPDDERGEVVEVGDRRRAIEHAVSLARTGDVVVVAGKGHETGQEVAGVVHPFSDVDALTDAIRGATR